MEIQFSDCVKSYSEEDTKVILENFETIRNQHEINPKETIILNAKDFPISSSQFEKIFQKNKNEPEYIDKKISDYLGCPSFARKIFQKIQTQYMLDADILVTTIIKKIKNLEDVCVVDKNIIQIKCREGIIMDILYRRAIKMTDKTRKILSDALIDDKLRTMLTFDDGSYCSECSEDEFYIEFRKKLLQLGFEIIQIMSNATINPYSDYNVYLKVL